MADLPPRGTLTTLYFMNIRETFVAFALSGVFVTANAQGPHIPTTLPAPAPAPVHDANDQ